MADELVNSLRFFVETIAAVFCMVGAMERKPNALKRTLLLIAALAVFCAGILGASAMGLSSWMVTSVSYVVLSALCIGFVLLLFKGRKTSLIFFAINGVMLRMCGRKIFDLLHAVIALHGPDTLRRLLDRGQPLRYVVYYLVLCLTYFVAWRTLGTAFRRGRDFRLKKSILFFYLLAGAIVLFLSRVEGQIEQQAPDTYLEVLFCETGLYILLLAMQWFVFDTARMEAAAASDRVLWRYEKQLLEQKRETIENINLKCHDLRHHIREIQQSSSKDDGFIREVTKSIAIYDSMVNTGSDTMDVILSDAHLRCEAQRIQLTTMVDGRALAGMAATDMNSLFGNLLENAMEYESRLARPEDRFISLTVRQEKGLTVIHIENAYQGEKPAGTELPATTKQQDGSHGFGMRSVQRTAEKYGGEMTWQVEDDMFQVHILLRLMAAS